MSHNIYYLTFISLCCEEVLLNIIWQNREHSSEIRHYTRDPNTQILSIHINKCRARNKEGRRSIPHNSTNHTYTNPGGNLSLLPSRYTQSRVLRSMSNCSLYIRITEKEIHMRKNNRPINQGESKNLEEKRAC